MNHIPLKKVGLNIMQSHCARSVSANTRPHQQRWGDQQMGLLSHAQNAVRWLAFIHMTGRSMFRYADIEIIHYT